MNTHTKYDWEILRSSAEVPDSVWEPHVQTDVIFIDTSCKAAKISNVDKMRDWLGGNDEPNYGPLRAAPGMTYDYFSHGAWGPQGIQTDYGLSLCRKLSVIPHPDKEHAFLATIQTSNMGRAKLDHLPGDPYAGSPMIRLDVQVATTMRPVFRIADPEGLVSINFPDDEEVDMTTTPPCFKYTEWLGDVSGSGEIGGLPIDIGGAPVTYPIESRQLVLTTVRRWGHLDWDGETWRNGDDTGNFCVSLPSWNGRVGSRNIDAQWGFDPGYLRMDAINVLPLHHDFRTYQYVFTYDEHKHAQQFSPVSGTGSVILDQDSIEGVNGTHALTVYFNQPYLRGYRYLEADWSADEWDYLETFEASCH